MGKNILVSSLVSVFVFSMLSFAFAQNSAPAIEENKEEKQTVARGTIIEIAQDGSYIIVDDSAKKTKFFTSKEFVENEYLEEGDQIKAYGELNEQGLKLVDYMYDYGEYEFDNNGEETGIENMPVKDLPVDSSGAGENSLNQE